MVPGRSFNLTASKCLYRSVADPEEGPGGPAPPYFWTKLWPEGPKKPPHQRYPTALSNAIQRYPALSNVWTTGAWSTSFLLLRDKVLFVSSATLLFQWCLAGRNWANMGETEQICTQWYRLPKVWTMPFWAGNLVQSSSRYQVWTSPYSLNLIINRT